MSLYRKPAVTFTSSVAAWKIATSIKKISLDKSEKISLKIKIKTSYTLKLRLIVNIMKIFKPKLIFDIFIVTVLRNKF